jgi:hypothetical protein
MKAQTNLGGYENSEKILLRYYYNYQCALLLHLQY